MSTTIAIRPARCLTFLFFIALTSLASGASVSARTANSRTLFDPPRLATLGDEVVLVSTRKIGTVCKGEVMSRRLQCQRWVANSVAIGRERSPVANSKSWKVADYRSLLSPYDLRPMIVYIHGNRVAAEQDKAQGLSVYRSLKASGQLDGPVRFVIWSWPADQLARPIKDYLVKARRTNPVAWQLAWLLDKLPTRTPLSLVGYSYGARVVTGATHLLAGGRLGPLQLEERLHPQRPPVRAALLAAAYDADWLQPERFYSKSLTQIESLVVTTNELDPAMRFYHFSNGRGRMHALGKSGIYQPLALGSAASAVHRIDVTREVGRSHALQDYLAAEAKMRRLWGALTAATTHSGMQTAAR